MHLAQNALHFMKILQTTKSNKTKGECSCSRFLWIFSINDSKKHTCPPKSRFWRNPSLHSASLSCHLFITESTSVNQSGPILFLTQYFDSLKRLLPVDSFVTFEQIWCSITKIYTFDYSIKVKCLIVLGKISHQLLFFHSLTKSSIYITEQWTTVALITTFFFCAESKN